MDFVWTDIKENLPNNRDTVLIGYYDEMDEQSKVTIGWHTTKNGIRSAEFSDDLYDEYDSIHKDFFLKEGWYDQSIEGLHITPIYYVFCWGKIPKLSL